jgi:Protein of unknown function (DUF4011)/REase_MTES_1575/AAA domain/Protein of unknown function (DUF3320)
MSTTSSNQQITDRLEDWRRRLIDLSYRNRLIKYAVTRASTLEIESPEIATLFDDLDGGKPWNFYFPPEDEDEGNHDDDDATTVVDQLVIRAARAARTPRTDEIVVRGDLTAHRINRILDNLGRKSNAEFQDKALRILYLAAGFLDWRDPTRGHEPLSSPLILVPVELRRETARHPYRLFFVDDEEIVINPSLTEKLRRDVKLDIPEEWIWEDKPVEVELDEIEQAIQGTGWSVRRDAVLGLFSFQKYVMYRDLLDNEDVILAHPVVQSLGSGRLGEDLAASEDAVPPLSHLDEVQPPHDDFGVLDADATQRRCIEAARMGHSFVMQGPPGTGKSQTIANVIADAMAHGKRVLFVSEKAAALDVVHKRLAREGLDEFCLLLHGEHAARREVVEALHHSLTGSPIPRASMSSHDLERLQQLRDLLNSTAELVHLPLPRLGDRSLRDVLGQLAQLYRVPSIPGAPPAGASRGEAVRQEFRQLNEIFQRLAERWQVSASDFPWSGYAGVRFGIDDRGRALVAVQGVRERACALLGASANVAAALEWPTPQTAASGDHLLELGQHLEAAPELTEVWLQPAGGARVVEAADEASAAFQRLASAQELLVELYVDRDEFRADLPEELSAATRRLRQIAGETPQWPAELATRLPEVRRFLADAPALLAELAAATEEARQLLGQPEEVPNLDRIGRIAQLASLSFQTEHRPERAWLVRAGRERAEAELEQLEPLVTTYQSERNQLFEKYDESVLELDGDELLRAFKNDYQGPFSKLKGAYRRDAKAIKAVRRDHKLPKTVVDDLEALAALQALGQKIDQHDEVAHRALGTYARGRDTNADDVRSALDVARSASKLVTKRSNFDRLAEQLCVDSTPSERLADLADELEDGSAELTKGLEKLQTVASAVEGASPLPLPDLDSLLKRLCEAVAQLADVVGELDRGARRTSRGLDDLEQRAAAIQELHAAGEDIARGSGGWAATLASRYRGEETHWTEARQLGEWLGRLEALTGATAQGALRRLLLDPQRRWPEFAQLGRLRGDFDEAIGVLAALFEEPWVGEMTNRSTHEPLGELLEFCDSLERTVDDVADWVEYKAHRARAQAAGWGDFVQSLAERGIESTEVPSAFQRAFWNRRLEAAFEEDPDLADTGSAYRRWIDEFRELDRKLVSTAADRLIAARNSARRAHIALPGGQVALLKKEAAKKRRHRPVRVLLSQIADLVSDLKPCLMMSPLTVSHFLPATQQFDLVVFDEASQVPPQDAINCIYRGSQLIVAGDSRQLPPTPFFQVAEAEEAWSEDAEDTSENMESILDACEALLPRHPLQWHYRSRHEDLISFSNNHVYDGMLRTFPAADGASRTKGVHFIHVDDGLYERGASRGFNRPEARRVAERVIHHLRAGRTSVGVITFNVSQADVVAQELDRLRVVHPELEQHFKGDRLEGVFVKHLESVQGDERDVILFSIGYGRDRDGKFLMNFGPLNKDGGFRRLNVAVTRARELVEVVSSVRSSDFTLSETSSRGARLLRDYIHYAEVDGAPGRSDADAESEFDSQLEAAVGETVRDLGLTPVPRVGVGSFRIDIGVRDGDGIEGGGGFLLGIETDGESYRQTPTARDRDRLRDEVLANLRWRMHRIWSLDWVRNREAEVARLRAAVEAARAELEVEEPIEEEEQLPEREREERVVEEVRDALEAGRLPWVVPYQRLELPRHAGFYEFHESVNRDKQRDLLIQLLQVEAPIHIDYAISRLAQAWGLRRAGHRIQTAGRSAVNMAVRRGAAELRGPFLWLPGQQLEVVREPDWDDGRTFRDISHIPPEEIDLAFAKLIEASGGERGSHLIPEVARVLGFDRVGPIIRSVLSERFLRGGFDGGPSR